VDDQLLTPSLLRAARALLGWSQTELGQNSGVSRKAIATFETAAPSDQIDPRRKAVLDKLRKYLEGKCGIEFTFASDRTGEGVRLRAKPQ
jgi:transcriptional regulator with XRE-family HTH domain